MFSVMRMTHMVFKSAHCWQSGFRVPTANISGLTTIKAVLTVAEGDMIFIIGPKADKLDQGSCQPDGL